MLCFSHVVYIERLNGMEISRKHQTHYTLPEKIGEAERQIVAEAAERWGDLIDPGETLAYEEFAALIETRVGRTPEILEITETLRWLTRQEFHPRILYQGIPWNREMPTRIETRFRCEHCQDMTEGILTAYDDGTTYFYCYRCQMSTEYTPKSVRVHDPDRTKIEADWKRNADRQYLTRTHRKELGLEDEGETKPK